MKGQARPRSRISGEIKRIRRAEIKELSALARTPTIIPLAWFPVDQATAHWRRWFTERGWHPFLFQEQCWRTYLEGKSGLLSVPTGSGKTYAVFGGPLIEILSTPIPLGESELQMIYITPLKALARDIAKALLRPSDQMGWNLRVEVRTGDTNGADRTRQKLSAPHVLITTPESLALLLTNREWRTRMKNVRSIVVDEWHELLDSKRGSLLELTLARLRSAVPAARTWAVSATIGDLETAAHAATGAASSVVIHAPRWQPIELRSILPRNLREMPWFGRSGLRMIPEVLRQIDQETSTVIFTNTRSQAELWFQQILVLRPDWVDTTALHHGSLDRDERERVENGIKNGDIRLAVATSSLDLGVDFPAVKKVIQIGSVKSLTRATQRAGRAFHQPGLPTCLDICPTHLLEIIELSALREGLKTAALESRHPLVKPLDVFVQFVLNCAFDAGITRTELETLTAATASFRTLTPAEIDWTLRFLTTGGMSLQAYPQFQKLLCTDGYFRFANPRLARLHRMNIGTIVGNEGVQVRFLRGGKLGSIDESFIAKLKPGDNFQFAGRSLKLVQFRDLTAFVRLGQAKDVATPVWNGTQLPISSPLADLIRNEVDKLARNQEDVSPELMVFREIAEIQRVRSAIPTAQEILIERWQTREGHHLFVYPWEGRAVHEGLGHLLAYRLARVRTNTISISANEHGFELLAVDEFGDDQDVLTALTSQANLETDITRSLNFPELAKRAFRDVARVAGLLQQGHPGDRKALRQLQMSSGLLFDVFMRYEPNHPLLHQAEREVRSSQLQLNRLQLAMSRLATLRPVFKSLASVSPFSLPLYAERIRSRVSTETMEIRMERLRRQLLEGRP